VVLDVTRKDEIGMLQRALSRMVVNLKAKIAEAEDMGHQARSESEKAKVATRRPNRRAMRRSTPRPRAAPGRVAP
jgi:methyl-accepting chemotaxis protein